MTREQMKSHFVVHTNGQDEWIKVDKRTYDKAIDMFCGAHETELKAKDERITELEAKLDGLRGYCRKQIEHFNSKDSRSDYDWGLRDRTITILDKLDEGKEQ